MPKKSEKLEKVQKVAKPVTKRARATTSRKKAASPDELIARRAYELFLAEGGSHGRDVEHWLAAEKELRLAVN